MKKVAVFFEKPNFNDYPFDDPDYRLAYHELASVIAQKGGEFWIARGDETYCGAGKFSRGWRFTNGEFIESGAFVADVIYDKRQDSRITPLFREKNDIRILNANKLVEICDDKLVTAELFPELSPSTFCARNKSELREKLALLPDEKKVLKPIKAAGGVGVVIGSTAEILAAPKKFPVVVQKFLDTSAGIRGVVGGIHDLRMVVIDGEIILSFVRTPPVGELVANMARGGKATEIPLAKLPAPARELAAVVDRRLPQIERVYSVDVGFENGEPKLIELNSQPAIYAARRGQGFAYFQEKLADALLTF